MIEVEDLRVRYRGADRYAVDGMSFRVARGEVFGFLGPNGAGKSTTQRVLTRLLRGYEGRAEVLGRPVRAWGPDYYQRIGVGFELPAHFAKLTAVQNLEAFASLFEPPVADARLLLERVDLADAADRAVATFSKGMQVRLGLARAFVNLPDLVFLDEPTSGLDPVHTAAVRSLIREQVDEGRTVFLTTHDMATADEMCDRVAFVVAGRIADIDSPRGFRLRYGHHGVAVEYRDGDGTRRREFRLEDLPSDPGFLDLLRTGRVETIHSTEASLDDVFVRITGGRL
ncbi:ABC transporter ATP-binding protein [Phytohabitans flavus]|uniref:ABC transporter ATP-binding protein n=1 Tax=Phytohabitans flavus TaxID=1076124 RepID=UPI00363C7121